MKFTSAEQLERGFWASDLGKQLRACQFDAVAELLLTFSARPGKGDPGPAQRERAGRNEHKMLSLPKMPAVERQDSCDWGHRPKSL